VPNPNAFVQKNFTRCSKHNLMIRLVSVPAGYAYDCETGGPAEMIRFLLGVVIGVLLLPIGAWYWFTHGRPPVAVADASLPFERLITSVPLRARIEKEMPPAIPVTANEAAFVAGAHIYREQCSFCHGVYGSPSKIGGHMLPDAPPLWEKHGADVVGVSDDPPGETYWKVANGIRLSGMPAYKSVLSDTEMWQVSLLLANANKPLPPSALDLLKQPLNLDPSMKDPAINLSHIGSATVVGPVK
jgi:thiosulfate dehydrogenase